MSYLRIRISQLVAALVASTTVGLRGLNVLNGTDTFDISLPNGLCKNTAYRRAVWFFEFQQPFALAKLLITTYH